MKNDHRISPHDNGPSGAHKSTRSEWVVGRTCAPRRSRRSPGQLDELRESNRQNKKRKSITARQLHASADHIAVVSWPRAAAERYRTVTTAKHDASCANKSSRCERKRPLPVDGCARARATRSRERFWTVQRETRTERLKQKRKSMTVLQ